MLRAIGSIFLVSISSIMGANVDNLKITSVSTSAKTNKVLFNTNGAKLDYSFYTNTTTYNDQSTKQFLMGEIVLSNVITQYAEDENDEIRVSVGWRNPQEDAYDITSFTFKYNTDPSKITCEAIDGYAYGSIDSNYYNWLYNEADAPSSKGDGQDYNGFFNKTIKQWTDMKSLDGTIDYRADQYGKDLDATNDVTIIDWSVTDRPAQVGTDLDSVTQTFNVTYSRPFKGSDLNDIDLETGIEYNLTSAYGCYRKSDTLVDGKYSTYNPDALSVTDPNTLETTGCFGVWQAITGTLVFTRPSVVDDKNLEQSISGEMLYGSSPLNRLTVDLTGQIETQITVLLLKDNAKFQAFSVLSTLCVIISAYI